MTKNKLPKKAGVEMFSDKNAGETKNGPAQKEIHLLSLAGDLLPKLKTGK